jgi:ribosomal protein L40E
LETFWNSIDRRINCIWTSSVEMVGGFLMRKTSVLRTDLGFMEEKELDGWLENIYKTIHADDIETIHQKMGQELDRFKEDLWRNRMVKICDKCMLTYPFHIVVCSNCNNNQLRAFRAGQEEREKKEE